MNYLIGIAVAAIFAGALWVFVSGAEDCAAAGGHLGVAYYMPMQSGNTTTLMPIYECSK